MGATGPESDDAVFEGPSTDVENGVCLLESVPPPWRCARGEPSAVCARAWEACRPARDSLARRAPWRESRPLLARRLGEELVEELVEQRW